MKPILFIIVLGITSIFFTCNKDRVDSGEFTQNETVLVNYCNTFVQQGVTYSICLDSVVNESRCPSNAVCVWQGFAKAKFTFTEAGVSHQFYLHTYTGAENVALPKDTVINGVSISFEALNPYPQNPDQVVYNTYKAEIMLIHL